MDNNTILKSRPRKRDNETVRREVPSEAREAFLDKCAASQYNNQNTEVCLWTTRPNLGVYQGIEDAKIDPKLLSVMKCTDGPIRLQ
jgi:hypothetical protein